jgi:hypothetical protein
MCLQLLSRNTDAQHTRNITEYIGAQVTYVINHCALTLISLTMQLMYVNIKTH